MVSGIEEAEDPMRRYAVLKTGNALDYTDRTYGGYARLLETLLKDADADEHWDIFPVLDDDFSFLPTYASYDSFVITGSAADAHADDPWILRLADALRFLHDRNKPILGVCFGHQILAQALGGDTGRASVGWEIGLKEIQVDSEAIKELYGVDVGPRMNVIESHRDQVLRLPPGGRVLAWSERTEIEMFAVGRNVLGVQCHPEFRKDVVLDIIRYRAGVIGEQMADEAVRSVEKREADNEQLKLLCKAFLKGPVEFNAK